MKWLRTYFNRFLAPRLKSQYAIFFDEQNIANLIEPLIVDQFWISFKLVPVVTDSRILEILYDDDSWTKRLVIKEQETLRTVQFALQVDFIEFHDKIVSQKILKDRPERVLLRGPY